MTLLEVLLLLFVFTVSLGGVALFAGIEVGFYCVNRVRLSVRAKRVPPDRDAIAVKEELDRPDRMIAAIMVGISVMHNVASVVSAELLSRTTYSEAAQVVINVSFLTPLLIIFGEALPKELFRVDADRLTYRFARLVRLFRLLLTGLGIIPLVTWFGRMVERIAGLKHEASGDARARMAQLFREGASQGALSESQGDLIERALALRRITVADEMVPWAALRVVPVDLGREAALRVVAGLPHSEFPAVDRRGNVVGIIRHIDFYRGKRGTVREMLAPATDLPSAMPVREALSKLRLSKTRLGIVRDPWGKAIGAVTIRDLIEPLTGELSDL